MNKTKPRLFADDTNLTASTNSMTDLETAVNSDLENLRKWSIAANKLSLNVAKTEFMLIDSKPMIKNISDSCPNVYIENIQIKQVHECKTLGVTIDHHLSWKSNTENISKKVTAGISAIRRIKPFVDQDTLILIYNTIVRSYFDYCCEVCDVFGETQSKRLQKLQNRAARITERKKTKARMMYKLLNKMGPKSLTNLFSFKSEKTNYHIRSSGLYLPKPRTNSMKNSFMYDGANIWNSIYTKRN